MILTAEQLEDFCNLYSLDSDEDKLIKATVNKLEAYLESKTDLDRTKEFLDSLSILYSSDATKICFGNPMYSDDPFPKCDKVDGYNQFYTQFEFAKDGKFLTVGAWE